MSRFANWFKKTADLKGQGPFALIVPTFSAARIESDDETNAVIPSSVFYGLIENDQPRIVHRQSLRQTSRLADGLEQVWGQLPRYALVIPVRQPGSMIISILGRRESPKPNHLPEYIEAFTQRAQEAASLTGAAIEETASAQQNTEISVVTTLTGRPIALNDRAKEFFGTGNCQHLEKLVGTKITDTISEKYESLTLTGQIILESSIRDASREYWRSNVRVKMGEATVTLTLTDLEPDHLRRQGGVTRVGLQSLAAAPKPIPRTGRFNRKGDIVCWLECEPLEPIPLGPHPIVTVGRHENNDLVLPHKSVSRNHATIKVVGQVVMLEDHGSANGVLVNGNRRDKHTLNVGDRIIIGPYELGVRAPNDKPTQDCGETTVRTHVSMLDQGAGLAGNLKETPLAELLQSLEFNQKTGTLAIFDGRVTAFFSVDKGRSHSAEFGEFRDIEAVLKMLTIEEGQFTFSSQEPDSVRTMSDTITSILLEASRLIDERSEPA